MKKDDAKAVQEEALSQLADALAAGHSEEFTNYLKMMSNFHDYSFGNCMLIMQQMPTATLVAGFRTWKNKHNRQVKKGSKGICILAPMIGKKKNELGDEEKEVFGFRAVHVFDLSQTEGDELPDIAQLTGDPGDALTKLHQVAADFGSSVVYEEDLGGANGVSRGGTIALLSGRSPAEEFNTLAHELAHELLHHGEDRKKFSKQVRELEAEAVAYVVTQSSGVSVENSLSHSADYIQSHEGDPELLSQSLARIQKTAHRIIDALGETDVLANPQEPQQVEELSLPPAATKEVQASLF